MGTRIDDSAARVGVDFGGVIVEGGLAPPGEDTALGPATAGQRALPGAVAGVRRLVERSAGRVHIVSKARPKMQARSLEWMEATGFFEETGLRREQVHFCEEREGKRVLCRDLGITHFIDDRVHLMQILRGVVPHLYLFGADHPAAACPSFATPVVDWEAVARQIPLEAHDA